MRLHHRFEWHEAKARENLQKHGVSFDDAQVVLSDDDGDIFHIEMYDDEHSVDEIRISTTGSDPSKRGRMLVIVWTERNDDDGPLTRIISARAATRREKRAYVKDISENQ